MLTTSPNPQKVRDLSYDEYHSTFDKKMIRQGPNSVPPFDFWPYVEVIPVSDYQGFDCSAGNVDYVYVNSSETYAHVLINSDDQNVFMAVVLDIKENVVHGHRLMNFNELYGLSPSDE